MTLKLYTPREDKMKVLGFASGSGNSLWKALELQNQLNQTIEGCPYEIVGVFSDNPESKAIEYAKEIGLPDYALNLKEFHKAAGTALTDMNTRAAFDAEVYQLIQGCEADMILLAGYVWATTDILVNNYLIVNVHPADLSVNRGGFRPYAGANGVGGTLEAQDDTLCASAHIATSAIDGGPLLLLSPDIPLDYSAFDHKEDMKKHYLKLVNEHSRLLSARVLLDIAEGRFEYDEEGMLCYRGKQIPSGYKIDSWEKDKPRHERDLAALVAPKSIAVIGASGKGGLGYSILHNAKMADFNGSLYVVNRSGEAVDGVAAYQSLEEIPGPVDLAVLAVPSANILQVVKDCGEKGVKSVVCITAGFRETGEEGAENELKLQEMLDQYNIRMLGPNCMGILNTDKSVRLNTTMLQHTPEKGNIAFITQSGALGAVMLDYSEDLGMGFSIIASLGNQTDVNVNDLLPILAEDKNTEVIFLYLEAVTEPMRFLRIAKKVAEKKPIILLKSARSDAGASAASSHTGSLAGSDQFLSALLDKIGIIRVDTLEQGYFTAMALSKMPALKGNRIGVITNAGGPGVLAIDNLSAYGFEMPLLSNEDREILSTKLLKEASTGNPIDVVAAAPPIHYAEAVDAMVKSGLYDALLVICVPPATVNTGLVAEAVVDQLADVKLPVLCSFLGPTLGKPAREVFVKANIPCLDYPEKLAEILWHMKEKGLGSPAETESKIKNTLRVHQARKLMSAHSPEGYLPSDTSYRLLSLYDFDMPGYCLVENMEVDPEAVKDDISGRNLGAFTYPLVAKIEHPQVIHKSDAGGVVLNIRDLDQLKATISDLLLKFPGAKGVLVQEQCKVENELILGGKAEKGMGSLIMIGAGGTGVEIYKDVQLLHVPAVESDFGKTVAKLQCYPLLQGYRGKQGVDLEELNKTIGKLSQMLWELPEIQEIDLNPTVYSKEREKFMVLDCRVRVQAE